MAQDLQSANARIPEKACNSDEHQTKDMISKVTYLPIVRIEGSRGRRTP